jgi:hypothetical protein
MLTHIFTTDFRDGVTSSEATDLKTVNASGSGIQTGGGSGTQNGELLKIKPDTTDFTVTFIDGEGACGKVSAGQGGGEIFIANVCLILIDVITTGFFCKEAADSEARGTRATLLTPFVTTLGRGVASSVAGAIHGSIVLTLAVFIFESNNRKKTEGFLLFCMNCNHASCGN